MKNLRIFTLASNYSRNESNSFVEEQVSYINNSRFVPRDTIMCRDTINAAKKLDTKASVPGAMNVKPNIAHSKSMLENLLTGLRK